MKRMLGWLLVLALLLTPLFVCAETAAEPSKINYFLIDYGKETVPIAQSPTFKAAYRVVDMHALENQGERFWMIRFELELANLTDKPLKNLTITARFPKNLQQILPNTQWYNEPTTLTVNNGKDVPYCIVYEWTTMLDLDAVKALPLSLDDFYNAVIEVSWKGGSENLYIGSEEALRAEAWEEPLPEGAALFTEETVLQLKEAASKRGE